MERVLKLNQSYEPIEIINWQDAFKLIFLEKAEIIREYEKKIHSAKNSFNMPAVIRLYNSFRRPRKRVKFNRKNIIARDRWRCQYCGKKFPASDLTFDHVIPKSRGGATTWENIVSCCTTCNDKKRDRTPAVANMKLKRKPSRPDWMPIAAMSLSKRQIPEPWRDFCYWDDE
jgi:5-methylcytosine-specific restriction endonuclease McrA